MTTGNAIVFKSNAKTTIGCGLTLLLVVSAATWNLRGFIHSEIEKGTAATNTRLEAATTGIRQEVRAGRESRERQIAEIGQLFFDRDADKNEDDHNSRKEQQH